MPNKKSNTRFNMNKDDNRQLYQFLKRINNLFKQKKYQEVSVEFENNGRNVNHLTNFYPLYARVKYIRSVVLRKTTQWHQVWFQESSICLSPNLLPYIPENYFDDWINTFYSVGKSDCEQWLTKDMSLNSDITTFLKVNASFNKKYVREGEPVEVEIMMISTLPKAIEDAAVAIQVTDKTVFEPGKVPTAPINNRNSYPSTVNGKHAPNLVETNNQGNDDKHKKMFIISEHQSITPNKRLFFRSSMSFGDQSNNVTKLVLTDVVLIINTIKLIFNIETSTLSLPKPSFPPQIPNDIKSHNQSNQFVGNFERSRELHIEPRDSGCTLSANLPPTGFVDVPAPIRITFTTNEIAGYSIILSITCSNKDIQISPNSDMIKKMEKVNIDAKEPFKDYTLTFYVFSKIQNEITIQLNWYVLRDEKKGKMVTQELPFTFQLPFKLRTAIYRECSSCRTEVDVFKTPLLTESSYSIRTDFTVKSSWPVTIESFEISSEQNRDNDEFVIHGPIKSISQAKNNQSILDSNAQKSRQNSNSNPEDQKSRQNSYTNPEEQKFRQDSVSNSNDQKSRQDSVSNSNDQKSRQDSISNSDDQKSTQNNNSTSQEPTQNLNDSKPNENNNLDSQNANSSDQIINETDQTDNQIVNTEKTSEDDNDQAVIIFEKPIINLPISLEPGDKFSAFTKFSTAKKAKSAISLCTIKIRYFMHSTTYEGTHVYTYTLPDIHNESKKLKNGVKGKKGDNYLTSTYSSGPNSPNRLGIIPRINFFNPRRQISIEKLKLQVEFDFPPRGSQFEMCEMSLKITNVSDTPLELVVTINKFPKKPTFFMTGTLNTQIGIFPFDPIVLSLKFFPLAHGSLPFPKITIKSAQNWDYCYWEAEPTIFISYPSSS